MATVENTLVVGVTGASGTVFARTLLMLLDADERVGRVHLVVSPSAMRVIAEEASLTGNGSLVEKLLGGVPPA